jgi:hypothetical protein
MKTSPGYNIFVNKASLSLDKMSDHLYTLMINMMLEGELKEWDNQIENDEVHEFSLELIQACDDKNLQLLVDLFKKIEQTKEEFREHNCLQ